MKYILVLLFNLLLTNLIVAQCTDLFISEYVDYEGFDSHTALEIYNPTESAIDLSNYRLLKWRSAIRPYNVGTAEIYLSGTIGAKKTYVLVRDAPPNDPALLAIADEVFCTPPFTNLSDCAALVWLGADALTFEKQVAGSWEIIDAIGNLNDKYEGHFGWNNIPPTYFAYTKASSWTSNNTLVRKSTIVKGDPDTSFFNPAIEWDSFPGGTYTNLGMHISACQTTNIEDLVSDSSIELFPNPISLKNEQLTIRSEEQVDAYSIYDVTGNIVLLDAFKQGRQEIQVQLNRRLSPGIYLVRVDFKDRFKVSKVILQE